MDVSKYKGWLVWQRLNVENGQDTSKLEELRIATRYLEQFVNEQETSNLTK